MNYILKLHCPDRPGILATVANALVAQGGDIRDANSFGDDSTSEFFVRIHATIPETGSISTLKSAIDELADETGLWWEMHDLSIRPKVMLLVSKLDHCLVDLLTPLENGLTRRRHTAGDIQPR